MTASLFESPGETRKTKQRCGKISIVSWQVLGGAVHYHCCQSAGRAQWSDYLISVIPSVIRGYHGNWCAPVDVPLPLSPLAM